MIFDEKVFKPNDVRGIYPEELSGDLFYKIGRAFVVHFKCKEVIVGRDMRTSSPVLSNAFILGVTDEGANAIDIGEVSTDVVYFASGFLKKCAVMITSSHNPAKHNGIKFLKSGAVSINEKNGLAEIKKLVVQNNLRKVNKTGRHIKKNILVNYKKHVLNFINKKQIEPFNVVIDAGNGMAGKIVPLVYSRLPIKIIPMYFKLDGEFPNHVPNPLIPKNNEAFLKKIKQTKADFGMIFDGDADRVFFADEKGNMIDSSISSCILIRYLLGKNKNKNKKIIYNTVMSKIVPEVIMMYGGNAILTKVGHSIIKNNMKKTKALFACEHSGHYYYKDNYFADSGIITSLIICEILSSTNKKLSELTEEFKKYFKTHEYNVRIKDNQEKEEKLDKLESFYKRARGVKRTSRFNGLSVCYKDFWFNIRPSDTEDFLRINLEANSNDVMKNELGRVKEKVKTI